MRRLLIVLALSGCATPPAAEATGPVHTGSASYYHEPQRVACGGGRFNPHGMTTAHRTLPCGTRVRVWRKGYEPVELVVNDRGPAAWTGRVLDLSLGAAKRLGLIGPGHAVVHFEVVKP